MVQCDRSLGGLRLQGSTIYTAVSTKVVQKRCKSVRDNAER